MYITVVHPAAASFLVDSRVIDVNADCCVETDIGHGPIVQAHLHPMSILGVIVRSRPANLAIIEERLRALPGTDVAQRSDAADGRIVLVIEDTADRAAAATMAEIAGWPEVLGTSLVYEYSGPDAPSASAALEQYTDWRASLADLARRNDSGSGPKN